MIVHDGVFECLSLDGGVYVDPRPTCLFEPLFLGAPNRPSWEQLRSIGPIRFQATSLQQENREVAVDQSLDFGDSFVRCNSGGAATTSILSTHNPSSRNYPPAAMAFAFAQQWARHGHASFHGALLKVAGRGILVAGVRAAGKSVLSASALSGGGAIVTDDYLLLGVKDNVLQGERIRRFISMRRSWAADILLQSRAENWMPGKSGRRVFLRVGADDLRFPSHTRIDKIWVLNRPRAGRRDHSTLERLSQAEAYAALVSAIQPLLLGADFPHEREKLQSLLTQLIATVPAARLETGQDIVMDPKRTWERLLACSH